MAKTLLEKKLVYLDFRKDEYKFVRVEVISLGYNDLQVSIRRGKLGNKGKEYIKRIKEGDISYKKTMKFAYNEIYNNKLNGYISVEKMEDGLKYAIKQENAEEWKKKNSKRHKDITRCSMCDKPINPKLFEKINKWGRGEGNWDYSEKSPLYKKVICLECQIDSNVFQRSIDESFELNV